MIKLIALLRRPSYVSREEFVRWWTEEHAPPVVENYPGLRKYVISLSVPSWLGEPFFDGMTELWFDDLESARAAMTSPAARQFGHPNTVAHTEVVIRMMAEERTIV